MGRAQENLHRAHVRQPLLHLSRASSGTSVGMHLSLLIRGGLFPNEEGASYILCKAPVGLFRQDVPTPVFAQDSIAAVAMVECWNARHRTWWR